MVKLLTMFRRATRNTQHITSSCHSESPSGVRNPFEIAIIHKYFYFL